MNNKQNFWKKYKLFKLFKKTIKQNAEELEKKFNIRIDNAYRLYTVLNIPEEIIGESYSLKKSDIDKISENFIKQFGNELAIDLNSKGLTELYKYYEIKKVDKYSYLLVFGFSLFRSDKYYNILYWRVLPAISILAIVTSLFLLFL